MYHVVSTPRSPPSSLSWPLPLAISPLLSLIPNKTASYVSSLSASIYIMGLLRYNYSCLIGRRCVDDVTTSDLPPLPISTPTLWLSSWRTSRHALKLSMYNGQSSHLNLSTTKAQHLSSSCTWTASFLTRYLLLHLFTPYFILLLPYIFWLISIRFETFHESTWWHRTLAYFRKSINNTI